MESLTDKIYALRDATQVLDPELLACVTTTGFPPMLAHKFVHTFYTPEFNGLYNDQFKRIRAAVGKLVSAGEYSTALWLHERPYRLDALLEYAPDLGREYFDLVREVWSDTELPNQNRAQWRLALRPLSYEPRPADHPTAPMTVYRGASDTEGDTVEYGLSWTTDKPTAAWFAKRFGVCGVVHEREVTPPEVLFLCTSRGEHEVVLNPEYLV